MYSMDELIATGRNPISIMKSALKAYTSAEKKQYMVRELQNEFKWAEQEGGLKVQAAIQKRVDALSDSARNDVRKAAMNIVENVR